MDVAATLLGFGFTHGEASIYCQLLRDSPATGYRIARGVGRSPTNIYQSLRSLIQKGAISEIDGEGSAPCFVPVPPAQLLAALSRDFEERRDLALVALEEIHSPPAEEIVSQLQTVGQVIERTRAMLAQTTEIVVFDMVPVLYDLLRADLDAARARGVRTLGIAYRAEDASATMPYNGEQPTEVIDRWPGLGMIVIVDGRELLIAQLERTLDRVLNAVYSDSEFLSSVLHSAVSSDIRLSALRPEMDDPLADFAIKRARPPGLRNLNDLI